MADELEILSSLDPVPGLSGNPGPVPGNAGVKGIGDDAPFAQDVVELETVAPSTRSRSWTPLLGVAAALLLIAGVVGIVSTRDNTDPDGDQKIALDDEALGTPIAAIPIEPIAEGREIVSLRHPVVAEPYLDLSDGDQVTLRGTNFPPNTGLFVVQCWLVNQAGSAETCDVTALSQGASDDNGTFTATLSVSRYMSIDGETRDCVDSVVDDGCYISVASTEDYNESGYTPIYFAPDAGGTPPPVMSADKTEGLHSGEIVTITGSGFEPDQAVFLTQCSIGGLTSPAACSDINPTFEMFADAQGEFLLTLPVTRYVLSYEGMIDCAAIRCQILTSSAPSTNLIGLHFDPDGPTTGLPDVTVAPTDDLVDGQAVDISVVNLWYDKGWVFTEQCTAGQQGRTSCAQGTDLEIIDGEVHADFSVARRLGIGASAPVDCAGDECFLRVSVWGVELTQVPLVFDPAGPLGAEPEQPAAEGPGLPLAVELLSPPETPIITAELIDDQVVISVFGFVPWTQLVLSGCSQDGFYCAETILDGEQVDLALVFTLPAAAPEAADCLQQRGCEVTLTSDEYTFTTPFSDLFS